MAKDSGIDTLASSRLTSYLVLESIPVFCFVFCSVCLLYGLCELM